MYLGPKNQCHNELVKNNDLVKWGDVVFITGISIPQNYNHKSYTRT